jgi:hypothetical protein
MVARFFWAQHTKRLQNIPNGLKIYLLAVDTPNGHNICIPTVSISRFSRIYRNWNFGIKIYLPSGNPYKDKRPRDDCPNKDSIHAMFYFHYVTISPCDRKECVCLMYRFRITHTKLVFLYSLTSKQWTKIELLVLIFFAFQNQEQILRLLEPFLWFRVTTPVLLIFTMLRVA